MRQTVTILLVLGLAGLAHADSRTGNRMDFHKSDAHVGLNPGTPDGREGGETIETSFPITSLPFTDSGNTCDNVDDYNEICPYLMPSGRDVVYAYTSAFGTRIDISLCHSGYDTKVFVYEDSQSNPIACNDDYYYSDPCFMYSSFIGDLPVTVGHVYYIVIDGYNADCGDYVLEVVESPPPVPVPCPPDGVPENEPALLNSYVDAWNGGCDSTPPAWNLVINWRPPDSDCAWLCGRSGWYQNASGVSRRDTDWYPVYAGGSSLTFSVWAEQACDLYVLNACYPSCSPSPVVLYSENTGGAWGSGTLTWQTSPGEPFVLWVGPDVLSPPSGGVPQDFDYVMEVCGHMCAVPVQRESWGAVKSLYR